MKRRVRGTLPEALTDGLKKFLEVLPDCLDADVQRRVCGLMGAMYISPTKSRRSEEDIGETEEMVESVSKLMHLSAHNSPRQTALIALNCLAQLDLMSRAMGMDPTERLRLVAGLCSLATTLAKDHALQNGNPSTTRH